MKIKVTLAAEDAATFRQMVADGEFDDLGSFHIIDNAEAAPAHSTKLSATAIAAPRINTQGRKWLPKFRIPFPTLTLGASFSIAATVVLLCTGYRFGWLDSRLPVLFCLCAILICGSVRRKPNNSYRASAIAIALCLCINITEMLVFSEGGASAARKPLAEFDEVEAYCLAQENLKDPALTCKNRVFLNFDSISLETLRNVGPYKLEIIVNNHMALLEGNKALYYLQHYLSFNAAPGNQHWTLRIDDQTFFDLDVLVPDVKVSNTTIFLEEKRDPTIFSFLFGPFQKKLGRVSFIERHGY